jgi:cytochrome P450
LIVYYILGKYEMAKDLFNREETNRRLFDDGMAQRFKTPRQNLTGTEGVVMNHGSKWQEQRRFMLHTLRDFGFGKSSMEDMINEELNSFIDYAKMRADQKGSDQCEIKVSHCNR